MATSGGSGHGGKIKDRIRIAKGRFLISSSIGKIGLRDTNEFFWQKNKETFLMLSLGRKNILINKECTSD